MKLRYLLEKLAFPLLLLSGFFILTTFLTYFTTGSEWGRWLGINWHRILQLLDLREENTLATWWSSMVFLATSASLLLLGWSTTPDFVISRFTRWIFQLTTLGACLLSADEVASLHETTGKWAGRLAFKMISEVPVEDKGFLWVPLLAPFLLLGFLLLAHSLYQTIRAMPNPYGQRQSAYWALASALICLPGVFVFETLETQQVTTTILTCFEETSEILGMYGLFLCSMIIARQYKL